MNTAYTSESSVTTSPYNDTCQHDTAFVFLNLLCNSEFLWWCVAERTILPSPLACTINPCLLFTSDPCQAEKILICSAFLRPKFSLPEDKNRFVRKIVMCNRIVSPARKLGSVSFDTAYLNTASFVTHELQCFVLTNRMMIRRRTLNIKTPRNHHGTVTCCDTCNCSRARAVHFSRVGSHLARAPPCEPKRFPPRATLYTPSFVTGITQQLET